MHHDIQRIRDHDEDGLRRVLHDLGHDLLHDLRVLAGQGQALMADTGLDARAGGADNDIRVLQVFPGAGVDVNACLKIRRHGMHHIQRLTVSDARLRINAHDLRCQMHRDGACEHGRAHMTQAKDG